MCVSVERKEEQKHKVILKHFTTTALECKPLVTHIHIYQANQRQKLLYVLFPLFYYYIYFKSKIGIKVT